MREPSSGTYLAVAEALSQAGVEVERLEAVLILANAEAIILAIEEGIGLGFVSRIAAQRCARLGRVQLIALEGVVITRWLYLLRHTHHPQSPAARAFWGFVEEALPEDLLTASPPPYAPELLPHPAPN